MIAVREARVQTLAGDGIPGFVDGPMGEARFDHPWSVALDAAGSLYVADTSNHRIRKIAREGVVTTFAGEGRQGWADGLAAFARFGWPRGVAVDAAGNVYVADSDNNRIRRITPQGAVTTLAGDGSRGFVDGARGVARFDYPWGVACDAAGNVVVADAGNRRIRKVSPGGTATTVAGDGVAGFHDGPGAQARLASPRTIAIAADGALVFADHGNSRIRVVTPAGAVATIAGDGRGAWRDGPGPQASFKDACGVAFGPDGTLYVADSDNHCIRAIGPDGVVTTIAGAPGAAPDLADGAGAAARFNSPRGLTVGPDGAIYVADTLNHAIRRLIPG